MGIQAYNERGEKIDYAIFAGDYTVDDGDNKLALAITTTNAEWLAHARPIIRAYLAMEEACMASAICEVHYGRTDSEKQRTRDYREADGYRKEAQRQLYELIEGIRDNAIADHSAEVSYDEADDAVIDAVEEFNTELSRAVITVEAAINAIGDEA